MKKNKKAIRSAKKPRSSGKLIYKKRANNKPALKAIGDRLKSKKAPKKNLSSHSGKKGKKVKIVKKQAKSQNLKAKIKPNIKPKISVPKAVKVAEKAVEVKVRELNRQDLATITTILADSNIRQTLIELGGENALALIRSIRGSHSDDELAKKLKLKISDVRATLNKLHSEGIVNYLREKDNETGWYSYSWSLNVEKIERWANKQNNRLSFVGTGADHYVCASCGAPSIVDFETAMGINFKCDRCEKLLEFLDEKMIGNLFENKK